MYFCINCRTHDSGNDSSDLEKRSRRDRDGESSKSKKKHKKHKKNKKSKKYDVDGKEKYSSSKKHKKHHKRSKSSDGFSSDSNTDVAVVKTKGDSVVSSSSRHDVETKLPPQTTSTLNTKFTEIMKSNGHVVVAKAPTVTKYNGNGVELSRRDSNTSKIPTDPNKLVEFITKSLDPNTSTQVVSSASDSDTVRDVDSPDVAVIEEDDLNLEELMRQKALLQARLGGIVMSDSESENSRKTPLSSSTAAMSMAATISTNKSITDDKNNDKTKLKRIAEPANDIILLDDSSNEASEKPSPPKKRSRSSRSRSRERAYKDRSSGNSRNNRDNNRDNRDGNRDNDKSAKVRRSDVENRFKEDLRKEIDRDKERGRNSPKRQSSSTLNRNSPKRQSSSALKTGTYSPSPKPRTSMPERIKTQSSSSTTASSVQREREVNKFGLKTICLYLTESHFVRK